MKDNLARVADEPPSDIDELIASLERQHTLPVQPQGAPGKLPSEVTEEVTIHPPDTKPANAQANRKGGVPKFFKHEVLAIREDERTIGDIAVAWNCSFDTILRVRQQGRFANIPYVARDEIEMVDGVAHRVIMRDFSPVGSKKGRPFKSGRKMALTQEEMVAIAQDARHSNIIAKDYNISRAYVNKVRRELGTVLLHRVPLTDAIIDEIKRAPGRYEDIALFNRVPVALVKWIKGVT